MEKVMVGSNMMEEVDCGNFFDHIDDLLEFPTDDILDCDFPAGGNSSSFNSIMSNCSTGNLLGTDSVFPGDHTSDFSAELSVPYEDIAQLEWLSNFVEDSFSGGGMTMEKLQDNSCPSLDKVPSNNTNNLQQFQTSSPISVLESSSSCSNNNNSNGGIPISHEKRARSKRPRPATFSPRPAIHHLIPTPSLSSSSSVTVGELAHGALVPCSSSESGTGTGTATPTIAIESRPPPLSKKGKKQLGNDKQESKKKKKIKIVPPSSSKLADHDDEYSCWNNSQDPNPTAGPVLAVRKCMHCEITKTPQWRAGPMGPKTLCNACGVRYKSGRLYPEYRPAASPTFIPAIHSNSHKKVIEMRTKSTSMAPETDKIKATSTGSIVISNAGDLEATSNTTDHHHHHQVELISRTDLTVAPTSF